uniref:Uncharacterized protein n=1 Tax=Anguilla anguilla TaxID=7936 RepID=A0A0E9SQC9_ANGAN
MTKGFPLCIVHQITSHSTYKVPLTH